MKPLLFVNGSWAISITNPVLPEGLLIEHKQDNDIGAGISVVANIGLFILIEFQTKKFLVPSKLVQYLIWSIENGISHQFSEDEKLDLVGMSVDTTIIASLKRQLLREAELINNPPSDRVSSEVEHFSDIPIDMPGDAYYEALAMEASNHDAT